MTEKLELTPDSANLIRQWFDAVQDLNPDYLDGHDYQTAKWIYEYLGMRVPNSIIEGMSR